MRGGGGAAAALVAAAAAAALACVQNAARDMTGRTDGQHAIGKRRCLAPLGKRAPTFVFGSGTPRPCPTT